MAGQERSFFKIPVSAPNEVTSEKIKAYEDRVKAEQEKWPWWKKKLTKAVENTMDIGMNFMGIPINQSHASKFGSDLNELSGAGLPFAAFGPKGISKLYHGTKRLFDKFNPSKNDPTDVLGWMTHMAENPSYASSYAEGLPSWHPDTKDYKANILIAEPEAKNVLDLVDPNADDISQALAFSENKPDLLRRFKEMRRAVKHDSYSPMPTFRHQAHSSSPVNEWPIRKVAEDLNLSQSTTENMPWDAIRYHDVGEKAWAFPAKTPIKTFFGKESLTEEHPISPIRGIRDDSVSTGLFPVVREKNKIPLNSRGQTWEEANKYQIKDKDMDWDEIEKLGEPDNPLPFVYEDIIKSDEWKNSKYFSHLTPENKPTPKSVKLKPFKIQEIYDSSSGPFTGQYLLKVGTKKFPQTKMGIALAQKEIAVMVKNSAITEQEAVKYYKALNKYKPKN